MRVNIQMDLKEQDYLEGEVKKHLEGIARGIARDVMQDVFEKEIERIVKKHIDELVRRPDYGKIPQMILRTIASDLQSRIDIDKPQVDDVVEKKVISYMEQNAFGSKGIEATFHKILQKSIGDLLKKNA